MFGILPILLRSTRVMGPGRLKHYLTSIVSILLVSGGCDQTTPTQRSRAKEISKSSAPPSWRGRATRVDLAGVFLDRPALRFSDDSHLLLATCIGPWQIDKSSVDTRQMIVDENAQLVCDTKASSDPPLPMVVLRSFRRRYSRRSSVSRGASNGRTASRRRRCAIRLRRWGRY